MVTDSSVLIDQTIEQLEILAAVFADEIDERIYRPDVSHEGAQACRAAHARIGALLPALRAARGTPLFVSPLRQRPFCIDCE